MMGRHSWRIMVLLLLACGLALAVIFGNWPGRATSKVETSAATPTPSLIDPASFVGDCLVAAELCQGGALWIDDGNVVALPKGTVVYVVVNPLTGKWDMSFKSVFCTAWTADGRGWASGRVAAQDFCSVP